ncbi:hypothetical protein [Nesterenkonia natronophila]|uniref:Asparagine synthetase domain-containing protein n=1 Tax=Nesterenkonia natronophila TaxID=2174932 RepID=A0A3A4F3P2_9MICC|nr:hypothetical protein [Nesterenkonia natronophila]RJN32972.1 hypothetical protein D3250_03965 [Nesterenkonia natronophila]
MFDADFYGGTHHVPRDASQIDVSEDYSHLRFSRGYVLHDSGLSPDVPNFWRRREFAGRTLRWDPRIAMAQSSDEDESVVICGHALHPELETTNLEKIAHRLREALGASRRRYLDVLEEMFGQYVVFARQGDEVRVQSDAIGSRAVFYDREVSIVASHVGIVGKTLKRKPSRFTKWVGQVRTNDFPGRTTPYDQVWQLTPNTELSVESGRVHRVGPRPFVPLSVDEAADVVVPLLEKQVRILTESDRDIIVSASAGVDSRTSLAAFGRSGEKNVQAFTYTKALGSGRQSGELHRDKLAATMSSELGLPHQMFDLNTAEKPPEAYVRVLRELSPRRSNTVISWVYHQHLPHDSLHVRGQINGVGKWHFAQSLHFAETMEISARRMASLTKRGKDVKRPLDDPWWEPGEAGFQEYIDKTKLRSIPTGYRLTDMFLWEHRVANWNHAHIVESDVTFDTYQLFGSRKMIRLLLSVPELDRVQLTLFRRIIERMQPSLLDYPLNGKTWEPSTYDRSLSAYQKGTTRTAAEVARLRKRIKSANAELELQRGKNVQFEQTLAASNEVNARVSHEPDSLEKTHGDLSREST